MTHGAPRSPTTLGRRCLQARPSVSPEVRERLLEAWRGEIVAGRVYDADRGADAGARGGHPPAHGRRGGRSSRAARGPHERARDPDPARGQRPLSPWLRLQARIAPVDRLLAAREAAEDEEVGDLYKRSTGDPVTDELLRGIRKEERAHSRSGQRDAVGDRRRRRRGGRPRRIRRRSGSTRSSAARSGTGPAAAGSAARSTAPTTGSPRCSGSSPACPARPAGRASS